MAASQQHCAQFNGNNLVYILPKPISTTGKKSTINQKPLAKIAPLSAPPKSCYGTPPLKPPKRERDDDDEDKQIVRCKRKLDFARLGLPVQRQSPVVAARRNERERKRVKYINETFDVLKEHLPEEFQTPRSKSKELSKVEILRGAIDYITTLEDMLEKTSNVNFESEFNALVQASDPVSPRRRDSSTDSGSVTRNQITDLQSNYPDTPSSSCSSSQSIINGADLQVDSPAPSTPMNSILINVQTPSTQRVPELQQLASPAVNNHMVNCNTIQQVPDFNLVPVASPAPSNVSSCYTPGPPSTPSLNMNNSSTPFYNGNMSSFTFGATNTTGLTPDLFNTNFHDLQCASTVADATPIGMRQQNTNNDNIVISDLNANTVNKHTYTKTTNTINNNNNDIPPSLINCDLNMQQQQYGQFLYNNNTTKTNYNSNVNSQLTININTPNNTILDGVLSSSNALGYGPGVNTMCSPAMSHISHASSGGGFMGDIMDKELMGSDESDAALLDFASLLMGCDMK